MGAERQANTLTFIVVPALLFRMEQPVAQLESTDLLIGGERRPASDGATLTSKNPATAEPLAEVPSASEADVDDAVSAARKAFHEWRDTAPDERGRLVQRVAA